MSAKLTIEKSTITARRIGQAVAISSDVVLPRRGPKSEFHGMSPIFSYF